MNNLIGATLGQYQILEELGRGGMAIVYKGYQASLERHVAIKVLPHQFSFDQDFIERFLREARGAAALRHPNIVTIHDVSQQDGTYFFVMEFLQGRTLEQILEEGKPIPPPRVERIIAQIANALDYAHSQGLIHRDVKPSNIIVDEEHNDHVMLMDFGLVRATEGSTLTKTGMIVGTPEYMSPEQAQGQTIDHHTDIYSLGVVLYQMLTGKSPFSRPTSHAILLAHLMYEPPSVSEVNAALPRSVALVVAKALVKDKNQRYDHAGQLAQDLKIALTGKTPAGLTPGKSTSTGQRRVPLWAWGGAIGLVMVLIIGAVLLATRRGTESPSSPTMTAEVIARGETLEPTLDVSVTPRPSWTPAPDEIVVSPTVLAVREQDTATVTPPATLTNTPQATAASAPSMTATALPTVTPHLQATQVPTVTATSHPTPAATRPAPTATLRPLPTDTRPAPTDTPQPAQLQASGQAPILLAPAEGSDQAKTADMINLSWQWNGADLADDAWFDVRVWKKGEVPCGPGDGVGHWGRGWTKEPTFPVSMKGNFDTVGGTYCWAVAVIQGHDGKWEADLSAESAAWEIEYSPPGAGGGGDGGGGGEPAAQPTR